MLGKLVNKFKKQSLQDQQMHAAAAVANGASHDNAEPRVGVRKNALLAGHLAAGLEVNASALSSSSSSSSSCASPTCDQSAPPGGIFDSGTESDDDELERLESMSNSDEAIVRQQTQMKTRRADGALSSIMGASPPALTSSPPLISDIDTSSWDSMGCESGIVLRESVERDDLSRDFENSLDGFGSRGAACIDENNSTAVTPVHRQDCFPTHFGHAKMLHDAPPLDFSALLDCNGADFHAAKSVSAQSSTTDGEKGGAFRPVVRQREYKNSSNNGSSASLSTNVSLGTVALQEQASRTSTPSPSNMIGEKRRWTSTSNTTGTATAVAGADAVTNTERVSPLALNNNSPVSSRTRGSLLAFTNSGTITGSVSNLATQQEVPRAMLTARRTRVRVLYYHGQQPPQLQQQLRKKPTTQSHNHYHRLSLCALNGNSDAPLLGESPPAAPCLANKRGRLSLTSSALNAPKLIKANSSERPSLDFDKMRERMMGGSNGNLATH